MKKALSTFAAGLALCATASARAAEAANCLNPQEMHGFVAYFLPKVLDEVSRNCTALPADSYVRTGMPHLAAQLQDARQAAWPMARSAFLKFAPPGDVKAIAGLSDDALRPLVDEVMASKMSISITPAACGDANDILEALAPLSAEQGVHLVATILTLAARGGSKMPTTCPREAP
ncbi:MAG: hypothetical protein LBV50_05195 [Novosphingobium sp.]|nr:hypothetical protein [Novosphingobium sp.]